MYDKQEFFASIDHSHLFPADRTICWGTLPV